MAHATRTTSARTRDDRIEPAFAGSIAIAIAQSLIQAQRIQLEGLLSWQRSIVALQQEMWDGWVCRWGGGVPIDVQR